MEELEKLLGDNVDAVITLYRCCKPNVSKIVVLNTLEPKNMTKTEKMYIKKFTKVDPPNNLITIDWRKLMIDRPTRKSITKVWDLLKIEVDGLNVKKDLRRRSIDPKYLEELNYLPTEKFDKRNDFALGVNMELDYLKEIETLYKCCKPNTYGKGAVNEVIEQPSEEEKIIIAKFTKYVPSIKQWCIDWSGMGLTDIKKDVWKYLAKTVDKATGTKAVRGTAIPKFLIDLLDEFTSEDLNYIDKDPVVDIYNATGKIVHHSIIKKEEKKSNLSLYNWVVKICKENKIKRVDAEDLEKIISYLEKLCPVSYNKKLFGELPEHLKELRNELFEYFQQRTAISRNQIFRDPNLFHKLALAGYKPAELNVNFCQQGDISSYTYKRYLEYKGCFNHFNKLSKDNIVVGLGHYQSKIQQPFCSEEGILYLEESDVRNILILNIRNNLEIIKKYMDEPKSYYLIKDNKRFSFNFDAIALDIYYNEKMLVNPISIANLKKEDLFNGKEPVEIATILSQEEV